MSILMCAVLLTLLAIAAWSDVRERRIPDVISLALVALFTMFAVADPAGSTWLAGLGLAAAVFIVGWLLFARGVLGGGDVKLIAALTLWAGPDHIVTLLVTSSLVGGAMAILALARQYGLPVLATMTGGRAAWLAPAPRVRAGLPYGVAIAAGGAFVALHLVAV